MKASAARSRKKNHRNVRSQYLRQDHGITIEQYDAMAEAQDGVCAICKISDAEEHGITKKPKRLSVDHDHRTGALRGLLCSKCNRGVGMFLDNPHLLRAAVNYLEIHRFKGLKLA